MTFQYIKTNDKDSRIAGGKRAIAPNRYSMVQSRGASSIRCQKCLKMGHYTSDCKNDSVYKPRPTRTQQLKHPSLKRKATPTTMPETKDIETQRAETAGKILAQKEKQRKKNKNATDSSSSSSSESDSDSDDSTLSSSGSSSGSHSRTRGRLNRKEQRKRKNDSSSSDDERPKQSRRSRSP